MKPSEFWRNPRHAGDIAGLEYCLPEYYADPKLIPLSGYMAKMIVDHVQYGSSILEIGCNCGRNLYHLREFGFSEVFGVEINPEAVELAWRRYPEIAGQITCADARSYLAAQPSRSVDVIFTQSVLMHIPPEDESLFRSMARVAGLSIVTNEVEINKGMLMLYKWDRNYNDVFEQLGWEQMYFNPRSGMPGASSTVSRVFKRDGK